MDNRLTDSLDRLDRIPGWEATGNAANLSPLSGIARLLRDLGDPQRSLRVAHVAGTNGKGLTAAMLAGMLHAEGQAVGLYMSPAVLSERECVQIDGAWIAESALGDALEAVLAKVESYRGDPFVSRFDSMTAAALLAFSRAHVDIAVLEVGIGGTDDSTNVVQDKVVAVITPISFDHMSVLGDSLREIAAHKLGIARPAVPVVLAEQTSDRELDAWIAERLAERGCPLHRSDRYVFSPGGAEIRHRQSGVAARLGGPGLPRPRAECLRTALVACDQILGAPLDDVRLTARVEAALAVWLPGRLDLRKHVMVENHFFARILVDGAHNAAAIVALAEHIQRIGLRRATLVIAMAHDKLVEAMAPAFTQLFESVERVIVTRFVGARAAQPTAWREFLRRYVEPGRADSIAFANDLTAAFGHASASGSDTVVVAGSFYLAREFYARWAPPT